MAHPNFSLSGRRALITGASGGLGLHFAEVLAAAGAKVVLTARRSDQLETAVAELKAKGYDASFVTMDVVDEASVVAAFAKAEAWLGDTVDLLINNAGLSTSGKAHEISVQDWDLVMDTNLKGPWLVSRTFAQRLMATNQTGTVVHICLLYTSDAADE